VQQKLALVVEIVWFWSVELCTTIVPSLPNGTLTVIPSGAGSLSVFLFELKKKKNNIILISDFWNHLWGWVALGGLVVSVLATGPKVRGFNPGRGRWIFKGDKVK
jgi:hypothetical protein